MSDHDPKFCVLCLDGQHDMAELLPDETLDERAKRLGYPADVMKRESATQQETDHA